MPAIFIKQRLWICLSFISIFLNRQNELPLIRETLICWDQSRRFKLNPIKGPCYTAIILWERLCEMTGVPKSRCLLRGSDVLLSFYGAFHPDQVEGAAHVRRSFKGRRQGCRQRALTAVSVKPEHCWTGFTVMGKR